MSMLSSFILGTQMRYSSSAIYKTPYWLSYQAAKLSFTRKEVSNKVIKDELLKLAEELFREAFDANSYFLIMQQYGKHSKKYKAEMDLSPAFYNIVYNALQVACFMELAKLYDKTGGVFTIGSLLKDCQANISLFPEYRAIVRSVLPGRRYRKDFFVNVTSAELPSSQKM